MSQVKRSFTDDENELFPLLENDIGRAYQKIPSQRMGDAAHRFHGARRNDHSLGAKRTAGYTGADIIHVMNDIGHSLHVFDRVRRLDLDSHFARFGQNHMSFDIFDPREDLKNSNAVNCSRSAGNADDESFLVAQLTNSNVSRSPSRRPSASFN